MELHRSLEVLARKEARTVVGLISGTSADAVDAAGVRITGAGAGARVEVLATVPYPYPAGLGARLRGLTESGTIRDVCELNVTLGEIFAQAAVEVIRRVGTADMIGSHGQTVYHIPPHSGQHGATLQIGEGAVIAERTGLTTVSNFRPRDLAAGGTGAPLVPYADFVLFRHANTTRLAQNIGGIANVTVLPAGGRLEDIYAFDTGPGNMVIDAVMERLFGRPYDRAGETSAEGGVREPLLAELLGDDFVRADPPKATGRERYGEPYVDRILGIATAMRLAPKDFVATLAAFTAESIVENYRRFIFPRYEVQEVIVSGGGVHNASIMDRLTTRLAPRRVVTSAALGIDPDFKEAVAFAILANDALMGLATNVPGATGASRPVVLGTITPGNLTG